MLCKLSKLREVDTQLHLVQDVVALDAWHVRVEFSGSQGCLLLTSRLLNNRERDALVDGKFAGEFSKFLLKEVLKLIDALV